MSILKNLTKCVRCGYPHDNALQSRPDVLPNTLVRVGPIPRKSTAIFFWNLQQQANQPITFGELCAAMRVLPKAEIAPRTKKDVAMVICVRARYALRRGRGLEEL